MQIKFCPRCHREAYRIKEDEEKIEVIQGERVLMSLNRKSSVSMSVSCPNGHPVKLEIKPREEETLHIVEARR